MKTKPTTLEAVKRYNGSPRGKAKRKAWLENNKDKMAAYQKAYRERTTEYCKENKICTRCRRNKTRGKYITCKPCRDYNEELLNRIKRNARIIGK